MANPLSATTINMATAYPAGLHEIHLGPTGDVVKITFKNGAFLSPSGHSLAVEPLRGVDLIRIYTIPVHYLVLRLEDGRYDYAYHMPSCSSVGTDVEAKLVETEMNRGSIIQFAEDGTISRIEYPDGQVETSATRDLMIQEMAGVDVVAFRTYTLLEFRDRASKEVSYRVL